MERPWKVAMMVVASVGLLGIAALVGFMVAKQAVNTSLPASQSTAPLSNGTAGGMLVEMTPAQQQAQNTNGPWMNDLKLLRGTDGVTFDSGTVVVERSGVPSMTRGTDGTLYLVFQWFPENNDDAFDQIAVMTSTDNGATWTDPELMVIDGFPSTYARPYDPTITTGDDGLLHLFFTTGTTRLQETSFITSATSTDGVHYTWQEGKRMDVANEPNYDAAAVFFNNTWHLMTPRAPQGTDVLNQAFHTAAADGITFPEPTILTGAEEYMNWTGNLLVDDEKMWFYGAGTMQKPGLWRVSSTDGINWSEPERLITKSGGGDPAIVKTASGEYLIVTVVKGQ
jgi:hypothetical protein